MLGSFDVMAFVVTADATRARQFYQDTLGLRICTFPDGAKVAWFKDPDGNVLSLTQFPPAEEEQTH